MKTKLLLLSLLLFTTISVCQAQNESELTDDLLNLVFDNDKISVGAKQTDEYFPMIVGKNIALVVNQTSTLDKEHLVDVLIKNNMSIKTIFAPEHGFRGTADAGETIKNGIDVKTGIPIISLYGKNRKPSKEQLAGIDVVIFDIQDVGARFYTYISTMDYVMAACAENGKKMIVLDRPNPNGHYVDGPIRKEKYKSFVGMHPIPIVHGLTVGELACMVNQEGWLENGVSCDLEIIKVKGYDHNSFYRLPEKPSPNLPDMKSIYLYPHLCVFEGTEMSIGRGTATPFQMIGNPEIYPSDFEFTPVSTSGSKNPKHKNKLCGGNLLGEISYESLQQMDSLNFSWLKEFYDRYERSTMNKGYEIKPFFFTNKFADKLMGSSIIREMITAGNSPASISKTWEVELNEYKELRRKYLLYKDFE